MITEKDSGFELQRLLAAALEKADGLDLRVVAAHISLALELVNQLLGEQQA